jgi:hypothetical protein
MSRNETSMKMNETTNRNFALTSNRVERCVSRKAFDLNH